MRPLLLEHGFDLSPGAAMDAFGRPVRLPVHQEFVLGLDRLETAAGQRGALRVLNRVLDSPLSIRVAYAGRVGDDTVMLEHRLIEPVDLGFVQVGRDDAFPEIVQDDIADSAAEVAEGVLVELGPDLLAGFPDHAPETAPRISKRHDEQPRAPVPAGPRIAGQCAFAIVDLRFFARGKLKTVELLGINVAQGANETLDALVAGGESELVDQILIDRLRVAPQADLLLDPFAMRFACRAGEIERCDRTGIGGCRWSRQWGSLRFGGFRAGGHRGGVCCSGLLRLEDRLIATDRLAVDARESLDLALALVAFE